MIGRLSDIRYTLFGNSREELFIERLFDFCSAYLEVTDGTMVLFDGPDSYNAFATPENLVLTRGDGTVLIGRELIRFHKTSFGSRWPSALATSIAHEVGHLLQYRMSLNLSTRTAELHADYLAGWTTARFAFRSDTRDYSDAAVARNSLRMLQQRIGDHAVHGTAEERVRMYDAGRQYADSHRLRDELKEVPVEDGLRLLGI